VSYPDTPGGTAIRREFAELIRDTQKYVVSNTIAPADLAPWQERAEIASVPGHVDQAGQVKLAGGQSSSPGCGAASLPPPVGCPSDARAAARVAQHAVVPGIRPTRLPGHPGSCSEAIRSSRNVTQRTNRVHPSRR
jgi:hypothetical protein